MLFRYLERENEKKNQHVAAVAATIGRPTAHIRSKCKYSRFRVRLMFEKKRRAKMVRSHLQPNIHCKLSGTTESKIEKISTATTTQAVAAAINSITMHENEEKNVNHFVHSRGEEMRWKGNRLKMHWYDE